MVSGLFPVGLLLPGQPVGRSHDYRAGRVGQDERRMRRLSRVGLRPVGAR